MGSSLSVVLPYWLDRPALEALAIAKTAAAAGYAELWCGEMMTFDAFALAAVIARETSAMRLVVGPLATGVRTPASMALGIATVSAVGDRRADLALGSSTPLVVERWHGRPFARPLARMRETVAALRPMLDGRPSSLAGAEVSTSGFRLASEPPQSTITVAAFAPRMIELAAEVADRVVVNLVTPSQVARIRRTVDAAAARAGRTPPPLAVWVPAALDPGPEAWQQILRQLVVYVGAAGYGEMFTEAGFASTVALASSGAHPRDVLAAIPRELAEAIGAIGDASQVRARVAEFAQAGADEVGIVPVTAGDDAGARVLDAMRPR